MQAQYHKLFHQTLATAYAQSMRLQLAHWNVVGEQFLSWHEATEQWYEEQQKWIDQLAERMRQQGVAVQNGFVWAQTHSVIAHEESALVEQGDWLACLADDYARAEKLVAELAGQAARQDDLVTEDLCVQYLHHLAKVRWMIDASQQKG